MQGERQGVGGPRRQEQLRPLPPSLAGRQRAEFGGGQVVDGRAPPAGGGQQLVGRGHGLQPAAEVLQEALQRGGPLGGLQSQRLHRRQDVLHPVVQFRHQGEALFLLEPPAAHVADDARDADRAALGIAADHAADPGPDDPPVVGAHEAELQVIGPAGGENLGLARLVGVAVVRMDEGVERMAALGGALARRQAGDGRHAFADRQDVAFEVPFELAKAGRLDGHFQAFAVQPATSLLARHGPNIGMCARRRDREPWVAHSVWARRGDRGPLCARFAPAAEPA